MAIYFTKSRISTSPLGVHLRAGAGILFGLLLIYLSLTHYSTTTKAIFSQSQVKPAQPFRTLGASTCPTSAAAEDVLVVLKTGASESHRLLPVHARTELKCIPRFIVVSDLQEEVESLHVVDVLRDYPDGVKNRQEFQYYDTLHAMKEAGQAIDKSVADSTEYKEDNRGWQLDKWKFMPEIKAAVNESSVKWYVFMETDTFLVWSNLLRFLDRYNPKERYYLGSFNLIGDLGYAHGGSGFIMSNKVAQELVEYEAIHPDKVIKLTDDVNCGDCLVGSVANEIDLKVTVAWPHIQGETPLSLDYTEHHWCFPVVSFHHMSPGEMTMVWELEQAWEENRPILHMDIYRHFVEPVLVERRNGWNNRSGREVNDENEDGTKSGDSFEACRRACETNSNCVQFLWEFGSCRTEDLLRFGVAADAEGMTSGFLLDRVETYIKKLGKCNTIAWTDVHQR